MTRQIFFDTETTGLDPKDGHKIIEIGCVELIDRKYTGNNFHYYINPNRLIDAGALKVHGITQEFLDNKPIFADIAKEFLEYIKDSELIAHNAKFDVGFLDYELSILEKYLGGLIRLRNYVKITDSLALAKELHPGQRNSLDALCKRYEIDNSNRDLHGALLDSKLLAEVYLAMTGGQGTIEFFDYVDNNSKKNTLPKHLNNNKKAADTNYKLKIIYANEDELVIHNKFIKYE